MANDDFIILGVADLIKHRNVLTEAMTFPQIWKSTHDHFGSRINNAKFVKAYRPRALIVRDDTIIARFNYISQPSTEGKSHYGYVQFFPSKEFVKKNGRMQKVVSRFAKGKERQEIRLYGAQIPFKMIRAADMVNMWCKVSCDCFAGDTKVSLLDGREVEIKDLVGTTDNWGYSCVEGSNGEIIPNRILKVWERGVKKLVKVTLDNGETIKCTPDHLFMLRDGTYAEAHTLGSGTSLMPLYRKLSERVLDGYEMVFQQDGGWKYTHRLVANHCHPEGAGKGKHVHHASYDKRNNNPDKLVWMDRLEHAKMHRDNGLRAAARNNANPTEKLTSARRRNAKHMADTCNSTPQKREAVRAGFKRTWDNPEKRAVLIAKKEAMWKNPEIVEKAKKAMSEAWTPERKEAASKRRSELNASPDHALKTSRSWTPERRAALVELNRTRDRAGYKNHVQEAPAPNNHKVVSVEEIGEEMTYDMMMEGVPNFALSAGVFVHNCSDFKFRHEVALNKHGAADIKFSNGEDPVKTNPNKNPGACKHILSCINFLINGDSLQVDLDGKPSDLKNDPKTEKPTDTKKPDAKPDATKKPEDSAKPSDTQPAPEDKASEGEQTKEDSGEQEPALKDMMADEDAPPAEDPELDANGLPKKKKPGNPQSI